METKQILEHAIADYSMGRKAALRCLIWFGFGYHKATLEGDKAARDYLSDVRALLKGEGAVKSEQSTKAKITKAVGEAFGQLFGPELASEWDSDAHLVQACFHAAQASGATTVKRLEDWARHGDADYTDAAKERAAKEKAEKLEADAAARRDIDAGSVLNMGFDDVVAPVQNLNPETVVDDLGQEHALGDEPGVYLVNMSDADLAALAQAVADEMARRENAEQAAVA